YKMRKGVVYHSQDHFTSRFITETGSIWYHDGLYTGQGMEYEGDVNTIEFGTCRSCVATCAVYIIPSAISQNSDLPC
ncbi:hypothetical protein BYT27DRAFT_7112064, partial [Phlegmacium glaucopus]